MLDAKLASLPTALLSSESLSDKVDAPQLADVVGESTDAYSNVLFKGFSNIQNLMFKYANCKFNTHSCDVALMCNALMQQTFVKGDGLPNL